MGWTIEMDCMIDELTHLTCFKYSSHVQPKPAEKPAKEYAFQLDPFQQAAIGFIEKG